MSKVIDITDRFSDEKPSITIKGKNYIVDDSMANVFKFEEMAGKGNKGALEAVKLVIGKEAFDEIGVDKMSIGNFRTFMVALLASMQGLTYEDAESRFRQQGF